jgi:hypothetical protein
MEKKYIFLMFEVLLITLSLIAFSKNCISLDFIFLQENWIAGSHYRWFN